MFSVNVLSVREAHERAADFIREAERDRQTDGLAPTRDLRPHGKGGLSRWMRQVAFGLPAMGGRRAALTAAE